MSAGVYYHRKCGAPLFWRKAPYGPCECVRSPDFSDRVHLVETFTGIFYCKCCFDAGKEAVVYPSPKHLTWVEAPA